MSKGQLEVDVISAQALKFDQETCLGELKIGENPN